MADINDVLKVYYSYNCGVSWNLVNINLNGAVLNNNGFHPEFYVPASAAEWAFYEAAIPPTNTGNPVVFKFEYTTGARSNNVYIDDVNLTGVVGIEESALLEQSILLSPNPANETTTINYRLNKATTVKLALTDVLGKQILNSDEGYQNAGEHIITLSKQKLGLQNGIYFVKLTVHNSTITKKLLITE